MGIALVELEHAAPSTGAPPTTAGEHARTRRLPKAVVTAADALAITLAMLIAFALRETLPGNEVSHLTDRHLRLGVASLPVWLVVFSYYRLYTARFLDTRLEEFRRVAHATAASVVATAVLSFTLQWYASRGWLVLTFVFAAACVTAERQVVRLGFAALRRRGRFLRPVVIVGGNGEGLDLCAQLMEHPELGYSVVGFVDESAAAGSYLYDHRPVLGALDQTLDAVRRNGATSAIIASTAIDTDTSNRLARELTEAGIHVELSSTLRDIDAQRLTVRSLGAFPMMYVEPVRRGGWRAVAKRTLDVTAAVGGLLTASPLLLVAAVAIKLDSRGPVVFSQLRLGMHGDPIRVHKLRTMVAEAEELLIDLRDQNECEGPLFKIRDDPRITRVGKWLRKLSIDEIPQLYDVLRGHMSLVGPRPLPVDDVRDWEEAIAGRLRVKPGVTGMWQVNGRSDAGSVEDWMRLDLYYVDNWSLWTDLAIVAKTVPTVLLRRGAY